MNSIRSRGWASLLAQGEACRGGWTTRRTAGPNPDDTPMVGDGMAGRPPAIIRETRRGQPAFMAQTRSGPKNRPAGVRASLRPGRGAKDALRRVDALLKTGHDWVVDADLKSCSDTIPHERLMALVKQRVADGRVLALVESFLGAGVLEETRGWQATERGWSPCAAPPRRRHQPAAGENLSQSARPHPAGTGDSAPTLAQ